MRDEKQLIHQQEKEIQELRQNLEIEAALERVRSKAMAMQNSSDLPQVALTLVNELTSLGIKHLGISIIIVKDRVSVKYDQFSALEKLDGNGMYLNRVENLDGNSLIIGREIFSRIEKQETDFSILLQGKAFTEFMVHTRDNIDQERGSAMLKSEIDTMHFQVAVFHDYSNIIISTFDPLPESDRAILRRMANTFGQCYMRYLDLQKAEAQAREAQIEAALERVRARTMAMHTSDQLLDASTVLFHQLKQLGITLHISGFSIMDEDKPTGKQYFSIGGDISPEPLPIIFYQDKHLFKAYNAWKNGESELILDLQGSELKEHLKNNLEQFQKLASIDFLTKAAKRYEEPKGLNHNRMIVHHAFFKHGCLFITSDQPIRELEILKRFAKVFEQTYTRFLDLRKVEEQAREAQIEAALERVRAASMAMHNSEELKDVVTVTLEQLQGLNLPIDGCQIIIFSDSSKDLHFWSATPDMIYPVQLDIPYFNNPIFTNFWTAKENGASFTCFEVSLEDTLKFYDHVYKNTALGETVTTERWKKIQSIRYGFKTCWGIEKHTGLFIFNFSNQEFTPDENSVIKRFTRVFEQSYTRFLDLKKAEAQTREAQIEAALEKVRSTAMAMHSPDDLFDVVSELRQQMRNLGENNLESSIIHIYHDNKEYYEAWWSFRPPGGTDNDIITGEVQIPFDNLWSQAVLKHYHSDQSSYMILSEGKMLHEWYGVLQVIAPETLDYDDNGEIMVPDRLYYYFSKFQGGALLMITEDEAKLEAIDLLYRASNVFGLAYQRFRDLKKAEAQAILNKKEASLDRIRGQIASMRSIDDLRHITPLIWNELTLLEIPFIRCGIFIMNQEREIIQMYFSTPSGQSLDVMEIPFNATDLVMQSVTHWQDKKIFVLQWSREQFVEWTRDLIDRGLVKDEQSYYKDQPPPDNMYLHFIPFKQGTIYVGSLDQLDDRQTGTIQSIADTFSVAYARYEDFKILENTLEELRTTQTQLIHSEKMASLGELTAGIAHEIQNPLNFVNNFSEVGSELIEEIEEEIENNDLETAKELLNELIENLKKIHHHGERASGIVRGMLDHSRTNSNEKTLSDINQMCDEYLRLAYHGLRAKNKSFQADFKLEVDPALPKVSIASQDIGRVLLNLINNGFQAILEKSLKEDVSYKPKLVVSTKKTQDSIEISITDNGPGIPDEIKDKIFQPFFTTKPTGEGTGLGLSLAYDIIKAHGGEIVVTSKLGEGTKFTFDLPVVEKS